MPTQKIDPKVIFASDAPAIDKPPVFSDKTKGWDVARANDGRPEIKQMNKMQQDTDLKILWLNENAVLPYDASIDYPDGAVALKDGSFKQLLSGSWVEFLDDFADKDEVKRGIANRYDSSLTYNLGERVVLTNGDIVKSTIDGNTNDPNVGMTGWVNFEADQKKKNNLTVTPYQFGAFGDGFSHKLSTMFATLVDAQAKYPFAESLDDEADWCALQAFFDACHNNVYASADMGGNFVINKPAHFAGNFHKTNSIYGAVDLRVSGPISLDYFLKWEGYFSQMLGSIRCFGYQSDAADARTRTCKNGVLIGIEGSTGNNATASYINSVTADNLQGYAVVMGQNAHFSEVGFVRGGYCGSAPTPSSNAGQHVVANWSGKTDALAGQLSGSSTITVDQLPAMQTTALEIFGDNSNTLVSINNEQYTVYAVDRVNSTIQVMPQITTSDTTGTLRYLYGGLGITIGNNSANTVFRRAHAIVCGHGLRLAALYGTQVLSFTSEFCGSAITTARRSTPNIGSVIVGGYFEGNGVDVTEMWSHPSYQGIDITQDTALDPNKIVSMYTFLTGGSRINTGVYQKLDATITAKGKKYAAYDWQKVGTNLTDPLPIKVFATNGQTTTVSCDEKLFSHYSKGSIIYCFQSTTTANGAPTGNIVLNAGSGQTINGGASVTYNGADYQQPLMLVVSRTAANTLKVNAINKAEKSASVVYDPPSIAAGATASTTVTLTGAVLGDLVVASVNRSLAGMNMWAYVSAVDTVTVVFKNETAAAIDLLSLTIKVKIV